jgi:uncharacterized membrane protein YebE (DUF533 family)
VAELKALLPADVQRPALASELARESASPAQARQVYTAARITVDLDPEEKHAF